MALRNNPLDAGKNGGGGEGPEALIGFRQAADRLQARRAGEVEAQHIFQLAVGSGAARLRGAEQADERNAQRGRHVHGAGLVGDEQIAPAHPLDHLQQRGGAAEVETAIRRGGQNGFTERVIIFAAEDGETGLGILVSELPHEFREVRDRPAFVHPARAGLQGDPTRVADGPFRGDGGRDFGPFG